MDVGNSLQFSIFVPSHINLSFLIIFMKNPILVPTDFSEVCEYALAHACGAAQHFHHDILLFHVINNQTRKYLQKNNLGIDDILGKLTALAEIYSTQYHIQIDTASPEGSIFDVIPGLALEKKASFIFLGTHGKTGIQHLTGSFALKVIHKSTVPVIVVQNRVFGEGYRNIIFPVSNPIKFEVKINHAIRMAKKLQATLFLFKNKESNPLLKRDIDIMIRMMTTAFAAENIHYHIDEAGDEGNFAGQVLDYAIATKAGLIMILTNAREEQPEFILGPWDEKMIFNKARIPVMCINPVR